MISISIFTRPGCICSSVYKLQLSDALPNIAAYCFQYFNMQWTYDHPAVTADTFCCSSVLLWSIHICIWAAVTATITYDDDDDAYIKNLYGYKNMNLSLVTVVTFTVSHHINFTFTVKLMWCLDRPQTEALPILLILDSLSKVAGVT